MSTRGKYGEESDENALYVANVIANPSLQIGNEKVDATAITPDLIKSLHEAAELRSRMSPSAITPSSSFSGGRTSTAPDRAREIVRIRTIDTANCTHGNCDRRAAYLKAATDLLVADLQEMAMNWKADGAARKELVPKPANEALGVILTGLGSLSYGELAGERMKLGLILHDPEEEHDCFSDNTHNSHYYDVEGMWTIYSGTLKRRDGSVLDGPGIQDLAAVTAPDAQKKLDALMQDALAKFKAVKDKGDSGTMAYDQMIGANNPEGNALVQNAIDSLVAQTRGIEALVSAMNLTIKVEGSDSLDNPGAVIGAVSHDDRVSLKPCSPRPRAGSRQRCALVGLLAGQAASQAVDALDAVAGRALFEREWVGRSGLDRCGGRARAPFQCEVLQWLSSRRRCGAVWRSERQAAGARTCGAVCLQPMACRIPVLGTQIQDRALPGLEAEGLVSVSSGRCTCCSYYIAAGLQPAAVFGDAHRAIAEGQGPAGRSSMPMPSCLSPTPMTAMAMAYPAALMSLPMTQAVRRVLGRYGSKAASGIAHRPDRACRCPRHGPVLASQCPVPSVTARLRKSNACRAPRGRAISRTARNSRATCWP